MHYQFLDLLIDTETRSIFRGDMRLEITGLNYELLSYMLSKGTEIVTFDELIEQVWNGSLVNNETVTQRVRLLRVVLDDTGKQARYIRSVRGKGYQLCAPSKQVNTILEKNKPYKSFALVMMVIVVFVSGVAISVWPKQNNKTIAEKSLYERRLERAQSFLQQRNADDIARANTLLAQTETDGLSDPKWLLTKSLSLSTQVCRFGGEPVLAKQAEKLALKAQSALDNISNAEYLRAYALDCLGEVDSAIAAYRSAIKHSDAPGPGMYSSLAYLLGENGKLAESLKLHRQIYQSNDREDYLFLQLGNNYNALQYDTIAEHFYSLSFELYPQNVFSNATYPRFLFSVGQIAKAQQVLEEALERPQHADLFIIQADLRMLNNDISGAIESLEKAMRLKPHVTFYQTLYRLQQPFIKDEELYQWLKNIEQSYPVTPNAAKQLERALVYAKLEQLEQADLYFNEAVNLGFLNKKMLLSSHFLAPIRALPNFELALAKMDGLISAQRQSIPAEHLAYSSAER